MKQLVDMEYVIFAFCVDTLFVYLNVNTDLADMQGFLFCLRLNCSSICIGIVPFLKTHLLKLKSCCQLTYSYFCNISLYTKLENRFIQHLCIQYISLNITWSD